MDKINVLIVEDDPDWINTIADLLQHEDDIIVKAKATNRADAFTLAKNQLFDVILMDINLEGNRLDGIYAAAEISEISKAKILMVTSLSENEVILNSFIAGAINYIPKGNLSEVARAIRTAKADNSPYKVLLKEFNRLKKDEQLEKLTTSEKHIYYLLEKGFSRKNVLERLYISENTLKIHIRRIIKKLGVSKIQDAIKKVNRKGLFNNH
ncbi:response regulator transcription factor [Pseudobacteroides cellulosolvens]|uniref:Stage 0 sporulation protein A homolog n=1 Tax=Pseudobacteroides cellulosolvens ATCC 35603 = DSM 2933 TaxID=398512 RepID=A0A0L6JXM3_9FIRM|nr:response regulator transcription factor [Pseudobacteroides cellulosolvens]KNY30315.1 two component transcriptional regulator, LuxR family [Pseudobacteroides cellulosolvens ATCC 35603 = DSM 2933]